MHGHYREKDIAREREREIIKIRERERERELVAYSLS